MTHSMNYNNIIIKKMFFIFHLFLSSELRHSVLLDRPFSVFLGPSTFCRSDRPLALGRTVYFPSFFDRPLSAFGASTFIEGRSLFVVCTIHYHPVRPFILTRDRALSPRIKFFLWWNFAFCYTNKRFLWLKLRAKLLWLSNMVQR